jgi:hypothetical protein
MAIDDWRLNNKEIGNSKARRFLVHRGEGVKE